MRKKISIKEDANPYAPKDHADDDILNHPDYKPQGLTQSHKDAIKDYTSTPSRDPYGHGSSANMNGHLGYLEGHDDPQTDYSKPPPLHPITQGIKHHHTETVRKSIRKLSSAFTPENTNKKTITLHGGIPKHIGMKLAASEKGSQFHLAGFTSTSEGEGIARSYAEKYAIQDGHQRTKHKIQYEAEPGTALNVVGNTDFPTEREMILHHGAKVTYNGTDKRVNGAGETEYTHHLTVHNEHKPMEEYARYKPSSYE